MIRNNNNFSYKIVEMLSEKGKITRSELYTKLDRNPCRYINTAEIDDALLFLHKIGCTTKLNTYTKKKYFTVRYSGKYKDLGLFIDISREPVKQEHLFRLAEHLEINKNIAGLVISSNQRI